MEGDTERKERFESLLRGNSIKVAVDEHIVYDQLDKSEGAVWSLLLASGYLKVLDYQKEGEIELNELPIYELTITNNETKRMFNAMVRGWFERAGNKYNEFIKYLLLDDKKAMN